MTVNQSFNKTARHDNGFAASALAQAGEAKTTKRRLERLHLAAARLRDAVIECRPAVELVQQYDDTRAVFYMDPPYLADTRTNTHSAYRCEMHEDGHRELAEALCAARGTVLVSGYTSELYDELFPGWHQVEKDILKRTSNRFRGNKRPIVTEVIWSNRPLTEGRLF